MFNSRRFRRTLDVIVMIGALATVPLIVLLEEHRSGGFITVFDWTIWAFFAFELLGRGGGIHPRGTEALSPSQTQKWASREVRVCAPGD